ncbi:MAG: Mth938-like domain-containing protein [Pseudomonadota bacterium]
MDLTPSTAQGQNMIEAYGDGGFRVSGQTYRGSILVTPDHVVDWPVETMDNVSSQSLELLFGQPHSPEILLLGCGPVMALVPLELRAGVKARGASLEPMDTGAACRTYNVLLLEGRSVAAALIAID